VSPNIAVKICGITRLEDIAASAAAGARYIGLNFFPKSPRYVDLKTARELSLAVPVGVAKVAVTVDASDAFLESLVSDVPLDFIQLHGHETPERVQEVRSRYGLPVIKAIGIAEAVDLEQIDRFSPVTDQLLVDAKPPKEASLTGGNGLAFDWTLLANRQDWSVPWLLAGGLKPENVAEAVKRTGARQVDLSSGIEARPGVKDAQKIKAFFAALSAQS